MRVPSRGVHRGKANWVLNFVPEARELVIERFGRYNRTARPGLVLTLPWPIERIHIVSLKENVLEIDPQHAITDDNVQVRIAGLVYSRVVNSYKACYNISDARMAIENVAQAVMRKEVGQLTLDGLLHSRAKMNHAIQENLKFSCEKWGIEILRYEISDITADKQTEQAMTRQSAAERERRAVILESEGKRQAEINLSEARRQSAINVSEGKRAEIINLATADAERVVLEAQAQATSIRAVAEAQADGIRVIAKAMREPGGVSAAGQALAQTYLRSLPEAMRHANLVVWPEQIGDVGSMIAKAMTLAQRMHGSPNPPPAPNPLVSTMSPPESVESC